MSEALYYRKINEDTECFLCPHNCIIKPGKAGICRVRRNINGKLLSENYGRVCSIHSDPIEKKPLYHFFPGRNILSVGSIGCNLHCSFCQNWEISQSGKKDYLHLGLKDAEKISSLASAETGNIGIAYTYNEPIVWIEFMLDIAKKIKDKHLKNVMVTNGFINPNPLADLLEVMDAFSVDLKAFTESFYKQQTSSALQPVLEALKTIRKSGKHLEITNLVIPNQNDDPINFQKMVDWIANELGKDTILHISKYYPTYKLNEPQTSKDTLKQLYKIARKSLHHVYLGNIRTSRGQDTYCPSCNTLVISRTGYDTDVAGLDHNGNCLNCEYEVIGKGNMLLA